MQTTQTLFGTHVGFIGTERGAKVKTPGGATGRFVGRRNGVDWIAYEGQDFDAMCRAFDRA